MRERSETSLSSRLRGLPPVTPDAALRERVLAVMASAADIVGGASSRIGDPPEVRGRSLRQAGRSSGRKGRHSQPELRERFAIAAGIAAVAVLASLLVLGVERAARGPSPESVAFVDQSDDPVEPWIEASWVLEQAIDELPAPRRIMRADTASTIAALEIRIALIDQQLGESPSGSLDPMLTAALWRDRVDAMSALYQVRYGQSRHFSF